MTLLQAVSKMGVTYRAALVARNEAIINAVEAGESLRNVAIAAGLSHTAVAKIVQRAR